MVSEAFGRRVDVRSRDLKSTTNAFAEELHRAEQLREILGTQAHMEYVESIDALFFCCVIERTTTIQTQITQHEVALYGPGSGICQHCPGIELLW